MRPIATDRLCCGLGWAQGTIYYTGVQIPMGFHFEAEVADHCSSAVNCAKTTEAFEMSFGLWARVGQGTM